MKKGTKKFDSKKEDPTLIPQLALKEVAKIFTHGAKKYGTFNYSHGTGHRRYIAAGFRHGNQWLAGEDIDESGLHHLACFVANGLMALDNILTGKGFDDRNPIYKKKRNGKTSRKVQKSVQRRLVSENRTSTRRSKNSRVVRKTSRKSKK